MNYEVILVSRSYTAVVIDADSPEVAREEAIEQVINDPTATWSPSDDIDVYDVNLLDDLLES